MTGGRRHEQRHGDLIRAGNLWRLLNRRVESHKDRKLGVVLVFVFFLNFLFNDFRKRKRLEG